MYTMTILSQSFAAVSATALQSSELESTMLAEDKLYVVLAVVLLIWVGIIVMLYRNDRKIVALERKLSDLSIQGDSDNMTDQG